MIEQDMKPFLKGHVFFAEIEDGVYFNGGKQRSFVLKGKGIYAAISRIIETLNGNHSLRDIVTALPRPLHPLLERLISELRSRNLLVDQSARERDFLPVHLREAYADTLSYFRDNVHAYQQTFMDWRQTPVAALGGGQVYKSMVQSLASLGLLQIGLLPETSRDAAAVSWAIAHHVEVPGKLEIDRLRGTADLKGYLPKSAYVVYGADDLRMQEGALLDWLLREKRSNVLVGGVFEGMGLVGPISEEGAADFADVVERIAIDPEAARHSLMSRSVIGSLIALELMRSVAGISRGLGGGPSRTRNWMLHVTAGPEITLRPVFRSPARTAGAATSAIDRAEVGENAGLGDEEHWARRLEPLFDPIMGLLRMDDADLKQIPVAHSRVVSKLPRSLGGAGPCALVWGETYEKARLRATLETVRLYCESAEAGLGLGRRSRLTVASAEASLRAQALAHAVMSQAVLCAEHGRRFTPAPAAIDDRGIQMLLKILKLYASATPELGVEGVPGLPAFRCTTRLRSRVQQSVCASWQDAVREALGGLVTQLQFPDIASEPFDVTESAGLAEVGSEDFDGPHADTDEILARYGYAQRLSAFEMEPSFIVHGLHIGRIDLVER